MIDQLRSEQLALDSIVSSEQLISDFGRGSDSNFAYCRYGNKGENDLVGQTIDGIRREAEACDSL